MNCNKCSSRKVCFLQKQIDGLAVRMINPPFNEVIEQGAERTKEMYLRYEKAALRQDEVLKGIKGVIASYCPLYFES